MNSIPFTQPIINSNSQNKKFGAVEAFDDYFFLSGRKYNVLHAKKDSQKSGEYLVSSTNVKSNIPLNILKVLSYCTGIIPLIMLIGKAIARSSYHFYEEKLPVPPPVKNDDAQEVHKEDGLDLTEQGGLEDSEELEVLGQDNENQNDEIQGPTPESKEIAATKLQGAIRALHAKNGLQVLKDEQVKKAAAASVFQTAIRAFHANKELQVLKEEQTKKKEVAASVLQAHIKAAQVREDFQKSIKSKTNALNVNKEIADTEQSHLNSLKNHLKVMQKVLEDKADDTWLKEFIGKYSELIELGEPIVEQFNSILSAQPEHPVLPPHAELPSVEEDEKPVHPALPLDVLDDNTSKTEVVKNLPNSSTKVLDKKIPSEAKSVESLKGEVLAISKFITSEDFESYLNKLIELSTYDTQIKDKLTMKDVKKHLHAKTTFAPCEILAQRLGRYPLLLKELRKQVSQMGLEKELKLIDAAIKKMDAKSNELNLVLEVDDELEKIQKLIKEYHSANDKIDLFGLNNVKERRKQAKEAIVNYLKSQPVVPNGSVSMFTKDKVDKLSKQREILKSLKL